MTPSVSVIVPIFNAEKTLPRCLDSLANQTLASIEIICVDDGSTDRSANICQEYARKDPRFVTISEVNQGVSAARNNGLRHAKGDWICFVDADDQMADHAIERMLGFCTAGVDLVMGGYIVADQNGDVTYQVTERNVYNLDREAAFGQMYNPSPYRYLGFVWGKLFRMKIISQNNLHFNERIFFNEDRLFVTNYIKYSRNIVHFTEPVYSYYEIPSSAMSSLNKSFNEKFITDLDGFIEMKECILSTGCPPSLLEYADNGILSSYHRIRGMMAHFKTRSIQRICILHIKLFKSLGGKKYAVFLCKSLKEFLLRRICIPTHNP